MTTNKRAVTAYLDQDLYRMVAVAAKASGRSISNFVQNMLSSMAYPNVPSPNRRKK